MTDHGMTVAEYKGWGLYANNPGYGFFARDYLGHNIDADTVSELRELIDEDEAQREAFIAGPYSSAQCKRA